MASLVSRTPDGLRDAIRIGVLVQRVGGYGARGEAAAFGERGDVEVVVPQVHEEAVGGGGYGAGGAALDGLGHVPGQTGIGAEHAGECGEERGVAGAAGQDDVAAGRQGLLDGLDPHHGHCVTTGEQLPVDLGGVRQRSEPAGVVEVLETFGRLVGVDQRQFEVQALRRGDVADEGRHAVDAGVTATGAAGPDDQRHTQLVAGGEQQAQVAGDGLVGELGHARAECARPRVGRPGVTGDDVRAGLDTALEGGGVEAGAECSGGSEDAQFHGGPCPS
ncbi:hypothetical protein M2161_008687 [Streptomyces sp. SAI-133]|nr:hypothetical protein [Streptomyces sp. SAI-133]